MKCPYIHRLCGNKPDCTNRVCRSHFPESQPLISKRDLPMCNSDEHVDCIRFQEGTVIRKERKENQWKEHCPFASNSRCGRPWEWWCKGSSYPFLLTTYEETEHELPKKDENGNIVFTYDEEVFKNACLSGNPEIYEQCPHYIEGMRFREEYKRLKNSGEK